MSNISTGTFNLSKETDVSAKAFVPSYRVVIFSIYGLIIILGIGTNLIVIYLYQTRNIRYNHFNLCLAHLSAMNIAQHLGTIPFITIDWSSITISNVFAERLLCGISEGLSVFFCFAFSSVYCLCLMSIYRYYIIKYPLRRHITKKKTKKILFSLWVAGVLWILPNMVSLKLDKNHSFCIRQYMWSYMLSVIYKSLLFIIGMVLPVLVMVIVYLLIIREMFRKQKYEQTNWAKLKYRKKILTLLGTLISIYLICWLPFGIYWLLRLLSYFGDDEEGLERRHSLIRYIMIPCLLAGLLNPIFYALISTEFRRSLRNVLLSSIISK